MDNDAYDMKGMTEDYTDGNNYYDNNNYNTNEEQVDWDD
jgi:hypothetical protein